jgi:hypothetical protein
MSPRKMTNVFANDIRNGNSPKSDSKIKFNIKLRSPQKPEDQVKHTENRWDQEILKKDRQRILINGNDIRN